jgi:flagellar biosynthetic protein FliO
VNDPMLTFRAAFSLIAVLALLGIFAWALRRGSLRLTGKSGRGAIAVETATSIGDRRQLAIVRVEGRRLLVGLTPTSISLLTTLEAQAPAAEAAFPVGPR